jgi:hypothetical protein
VLRRALLLTVAVSIVGCGPSDETFVGELRAPVVYGVDDRFEVFDDPNPELQRIARQSIVALIQDFRLTRFPDGSYGITALSLQEERGLCEDERFANQPVAASCSGTLIDDDLVLTAGHCISVDRPCRSFSYVFNYYLDGPNRLASIRDEDVYTCNRVVLERDAAIDEVTPDFVVVQLDRPVEGTHLPVEFHPAAEPLEKGDPLSMIGFGSGLPAKIDSGARVADPPTPQRDYFVANLDAFEGHSGSAVFDSSNRLSGILLGGRVPDYVVAPDESCKRANVFDDSQAGEVVHDISTIVKILCDDGWERGNACETAACQGDSCEPSSMPADGGVGVVPADASGCSAAQPSQDLGSLWAGLGLLLLARQIRRRAA